MFENSVIAVYKNMPAAQKAVWKLKEDGFPVSQISLIARDLESDKEIHGYISVGDVVKKDVKASVWTGGLFGLLTGAGFLWIPGLGPLLVAGHIATALLTAAEGSLIGAAAGSLLGVLEGWSVSKKHILKYEEHLKGGKFLVIGHGSFEEVERGRNILHETAPEDLKLHGEFK